MQIIDSTLRTALEQDHEVTGSPLVIAEWNFNRIVKTTVTNIGDPLNKQWAYTKTHFPPSSLTEGYRPDAGMIYGFTGRAMPVSNAQLGPGGKRYYYVSKSAQYKYWISPTKSDPISAMYNSDVAPAPSEYSIRNSDLLVEYDSYVKSNKVKITFNDDIRPAKWKVSVFNRVSNAWVQIADSPAIDDVTGRCELWWDGNVWVQSQQLSVDEYVEISKVKVEFQTLQQPSQRLHIIEVAAMREIDISDRTQSFSTSLTMDSVDYVHPVGTMSANDGTLVIDNRDLALDFYDETQDFHGLMDGWCEYRTYVKFDMTAYNTADQLVRTSTMYSNGWMSSTPYQFEISLFDILKILQGIKCPAVLVEKKSIARVVSMILDMVGIDKYEFDFEDFDDSGIIEYFWTDGSETVFDVLDRLCKSHQCVIFTDEFGMIQLMTRDQIANDTDVADFTLWGEDTVINGSKKLANIVDLKKKWDISINDVEIKYKRREANIDALDVTGKVLTSKVWDTTDAIVIKASPLRRTTPANAIPLQGSDPKADVWVPADQAETWPYKGFVNVDGEIMRYEGKGYIVFNYAGGVTWTEKVIKTEEEKRKMDKETYNSYRSPDGPIGGGPGTGTVVPGMGVDPIYGNKLTGRLSVVERGLNGSKPADHSNYWIDGWAGYNVWNAGPGHNPYYQGAYIEPGSRPISIEDLHNWKQKPGWNREQSRWTVRDSVLSCDNTDKPSWAQSSAMIRDFGDTEYREFGTRVRFRDGVPAAGLIFCISGDNGYFTDDATQEDVTRCHRFYAVNIHSTALIEQAGRQCNEVTVDVKNGDTTTALTPMNGGKDAGKIQLDKDKWYDVDVIVNDTVLDDGNKIMRIQVYVDGQHLDTWLTNDVIRPTNLAGVYSRYSGKVDFECFYATTTSGHSRPRGADENAFGTLGVQLPAGQNMTQVVNFGTDSSWPGRIVMSVASMAQVNFTSIEVFNDWGTKPSLGNLGPVTVPADTRKTWVFDDQGMRRATFVVMKYSSTEDLSVVVETSKLGAYPYFDNRSVYPNDYSYYNLAKGGYLSSKRQGILNKVVADFDSGYSNELGVTSVRGLFYDDFGSIAREVREFNVDLSVSPAKGTSVYLSNPEVVVLDYTYNAQKGIFTLANASHRDEIVNGQEQVDQNNSIDHSIMLYGYVLIDREEKTKRVKNEDSIRKHGSFPAALQADWITTDDGAEALADWIIKHWGGTMDTIDVQVFSNVYAQVGDKVQIVYSDSQVKEDWLFAVTAIQRDFGADGLSTSLTLRRVR